MANLITSRSRGLFCIWLFLIVGSLLVGGCTGSNPVQDGVYIFSYQNEADPYEAYMPVNMVLHVSGNQFESVRIENPLPGETLSFSFNEIADSVEVKSSGNTLMFTHRENGTQRVYRKLKPDWKFNEQIEVSGCIRYIADTICFVSDSLFFNNSFEGGSQAQPWTIRDFHGYKFLALGHGELLLINGHDGAGYASMSFIQKQSGHSLTAIEGTHMESALEGRWAVSTDDEAPSFTSEFRWKNGEASFVFISGLRIQKKAMITPDGHRMFSLDNGKVTLNKRIRLVNSTTLLVDDFDDLVPPLTVRLKRVQ